MKLYTPHDLTIEGAGQAIRAGHRTCVDVLESCFAQIEDWEPKVNAWACLDREGALHRARELDHELEVGRDWGPLHGIPFGIKDIADVAGFPTAAGAQFWSEGPAPKDSVIVARLREKGAVILGKTVTTPYAWIDPPRTRNPWDLGRTPGGSSSGSAAAVATGMCLGALGTQTGGSLTRPAAFCGVTSLKPTDGFLIDAGIAPLAPSFDTPGFHARTVADLELIWVSLMGVGNRSASSGSSTSGTTIREIATRHYGSRGLYHLSATWPGSSSLAYSPTTTPTLGRPRGFFQDLIEPAARVIHEAALLDLAESGAQIIDVDLPEAFGDVHRPHRLIMAAEASAIHSARMERLPEDYPPRIRALVEEGRSVSAIDYIQALEIRQALMGAIDWAISGVHALVVPAALGPAPGPETTGDSSFNSPWNFVHLPTVSFPIGLSGEGMPLAIQIVGHRFAVPLEVARWSEQVIRRTRS